MLSFIDLDDLKSHLNITFDDDDTLLQSKIDAASSYISTLIVPIDDGAEIPGPIKEATRKLAADLYEDRNGTNAARSFETEYGVAALITPYRDFAF
ncbi:head-tail connector protein [Beijerinckia mobilis]|uniref:head-tail connector protein n=1 Tax=Beijerinckia mobilis TaxID=231434 RepID=UPI00054D23B5|nr:head-tail connector protein [Beijerinckia mobilis]